MSGETKTDAAPAAAAAEEERPSRGMGEARLWTSEIVGDDMQRGKRVDAGSVLDKIDVLAGRIAATHAGGNVVTLSFDRVDLSVPILHGDLVRLEGALVRVGRSSMLVEITCLRHDRYTNEFIQTHHCFVTMVAVDERGRSKRVPSLRCETPEEEATVRRVEAREELLRRWREVEREVRERDRLAAAEVEDVAANRDGGRRKQFVTIPSTQIEIRKHYMPRENNHAGNVFGGEILKDCDRACLYAARCFTQNQGMLTVAMDKVLFKVPVRPFDMVEMRARVVYVRTYVLVVEVKVFVHRFGQKEPVPSHTGFFTVYNFDESGFKRRIRTGLELRDDDPDALLSYAVARALHGQSLETKAVAAAAAADTSLTPRDA